MDPPADPASSSWKPPPNPPLSQSSSSPVRSRMSTEAASGCLVVVLTVMLTIVWRRRQRWRRTRPWLAKLRAEAASKMEKERSNTEGSYRDTSLAKENSGECAKEISAGGDRGKRGLVTETKSDSGSASGKRTKERRRRGKEPKPTARATLTVSVSASEPREASLEPQAPAHSPTLGLSAKSQFEDITPNVTPQASPFRISRPLSPHSIPLPPSPPLRAVDSAFFKSIPPALVLSGPSSPLSTTVSIFTTEVSISTPMTSASASPAPMSPAFSCGLGSSSKTDTLKNIDTGSSSTRAKLPAFPPASPLPPSLARKPPPLARRSTPSLTSAPTTPINRKGTWVPEKKPNKEGEETTEEVEFPTLNPRPVVSKRAGDGGSHSGDGRRGGRKASDAGKDSRKDSDAGRGKKPNGAKKKVSGGHVGSGGTVLSATPEATQIASLKGALEAARLREEEVAEERRAWQKRERELQTQVNQLAHQLHALSVAFAAGAGHSYPPYGYGYNGMELGPTARPITPGGQVHTPNIPPTMHALGSMDAQTMTLPSKRPTTSDEQPLTPTSASTKSTPPPTPPTSLQGSGQGLNTLPPTQPSISPQPVYPPTYLPFSFHPQFPPFIHSPHGAPIPPVMMSTPSPMMSPPQHGHGNMSPPQASPYLSPPQQWSVPMNPMHANVTPNMNAPGSLPMSVAGPNMRHPVPGRHGPAFSGSPRRGGSRSRSPFVHTHRQGTPSTPSVGSADEWLPGGVGPWISYRDAISHIERIPGPAGVKREREPESDEAESSSEDSDDSDEDSVIFEDGSIGDSINLSLCGENKEPELPAIIEIREALGRSEIIAN
ncbi:hypothetical protein CTheo_8128 [Ceratobasidium theobromae]|uniref:Uncharacterized protein n=1 Tax=Ceratobasidium theobromae TaxID=1582974 RepID=A0A5N5QAK1_9AGAM|nr:hypothetical protein CTheo_8128 [Ceratobasidium theobromae]